MFDIKEMIRKHQTWYKAWEGGFSSFVPLSPADFRHFRLDEEDLSKVELPYANFANASMRKANLNKGNFEHCDFIGTNMEHAILEGGKFRFANFINANLFGAVFYGADCRSADFRGADLRYTYFLGADIRGAHFEGANVSGSDIKEIMIVPGDLHNMKLSIEDIYYLLNRILEVECADDCAEYEKIRNFLKENIRRGYKC